MRADNEAEAVGQLVAYIEEMNSVQQPDSRELRDLTVDDAIEQFLVEYLGEEKGRAEKTVGDYRKLHRRWFSPTIGSRPVKRVDTAVMDQLFGAMRQAGLSSSRLRQAKSLYNPFFRWAKRRGMTTRNPMADFELPTTPHCSRERTPPEVDELCLLLSTAAEVVPDVAPILLLGAVTGMRRGELVGVRRSGITWSKGQITVDSAIGESGRLKTTKTRRGRTFHLDAATMAMLRRHCDHLDERSSETGVELCANPFLFSLVPDCSTAMPPDYLTKQVAVLKGHLGIEDKRPDVMALEDEALRLRRQPARPRPAGMTGPSPQGGMSFREIGENLGRSERWAALAVQAAKRRQGAPVGKLDVEFSISMVAQRQGHGPQVLARHYAKSRASADKKAADHLGRVVHGNPKLPEPGADNVGDV